MSPKFLACIIGMAFATNAPTAAPQPNPLGPGGEATLAGRIVLDGPTDWVFADLAIADETTLVTNGFPLHIRVLGNLTIHGDARIRAWSSDQPAGATPIPGQDGISGAPSYDSGPQNGDGQGRHGGEGTPGKPGSIGVAGSSAALINIEVFGNASGHLEITNEGRDGGRGGAGGRGGTGGAGEQGLKAAEGPTDGWPHWDECKHGPYDGGNGGNGGNGGVPGNGGAAGNGGDVILRVHGNSARFGVTRMDVEAGLPGLPGMPGLAGRGGTAGCGGMTVPICMRWWSKWKQVGKRGSDAAPASAGGFGNEGALGRIQLKNVNQVMGNSSSDDSACKSFASHPIDPNDEKDVLLAMWALIGPTVFGTKASSVQTVDGEAYVFFNSGTLASQPATAFILDQVERYVQSPAITPPPANCPSCCADPPKLDCVKRRGQIHSSVEAIGFLLDSVHLIGLELARKSVLVPLGNEQTKLKDGTIYYAWPLNSPQAKGRIYTEVDDDLLGRLALLQASLAPSVRRIFDVDDQPVDSGVCSHGSTFPMFVRMPETWRHAHRISLVVGEKKSNDSLTLDIWQQKERTLVRATVPANGPGSGRERVCEFGRTLDDYDYPFYCSPDQRQLGRFIHDNYITLSLPRVSKTFYLALYLKNVDAEITHMLTSNHFPNHDGPCGSK